MRGFATHGEANTPSGSESQEIRRQHLAMLQSSRSVKRSKISLVATLGRKAQPRFLPLCSTIGNSNGLTENTKGGFLMPSNRVSDCRASVATQNEDKPDSPTVTKREGTRKQQNDTTRYRTVGYRKSGGTHGACRWTHGCIRD